MAMIPVVVFAATTRMITTTSFTAMMVVVAAITTMMTMMMTTTPTLAGPRRRRPGARPTGQSCRRSLGWATRGCPCGYGDPGQRCVRGCCPASTAGPVLAECRAGPYGYLGVGMGPRPLGSGGGPSGSLPPSGDQGRRTCSRRPSVGLWRRTTPTALQSGSPRVLVAPVFRELPMVHIFEKLGENVVVAETRVSDGPKHGNDPS